jgi:hypothetical protein
MQTFDFNTLPGSLILNIFLRIFHLNISVAVFGWMIRGSNPGRG